METSDVVVGKGRGAGQNLVLDQVNEPLNLHMNAGAVEGSFGEKINERGCDPAVPAIERAKSDHRGDVRE